MTAPAVQARAGEHSDGDSIRAALPALRNEFLRSLRTVMTAGVLTGLVVVGVGSRTAMFLLRLTSDHSVRGMTSDDGFTIGRFTLSDTYGLLQIGAVVGPVGAATYLLLRRWLLGPLWFRYTTVALAAGAVGGSMLLHADGIDFRVLGPRPLTIGIFIAIPLVFGAAVAMTVDRFERAGGSTWRALAIAIILGPAALLSSVYVVPVTLACTAIEAISRIRTLHPLVGLLARAFWLGIALLGLVALVGDVRAITELAPPP